MKSASAAAAGLVLVLAGCAGNPPANQAADSHCIRDTGTRIPHEGCTSQPGRSYTHDDIERTGAVDTGEAIRKLDPSVR
ncbi:MAG TPA: hypothetical protein VHE37_07440 [Nevskiaceae bacterium]|nr:hypothetical protein [Nevskiaceae bacterium]